MPERPECAKEAIEKIALRCALSRKTYSEHLGTTSKVTRLIFVAYSFVDPKKVLLSFANLATSRRIGSLWAAVRPSSAHNALVSKPPRA